MNMGTMRLHKNDIVIRPDQTRVLLRNYSITTEAVDPIFQMEDLSLSPRTSKIIQRVMEYTESEVDRRLEAIMTEFSGRHRDTEEIALRRFKDIEQFLPPGAAVSRNRKVLLGAHFLSEYSLEAAALFNPSIVPHPDRSGLNPGEIRFILSLRAVGEGHISSIEFRTGIISADNTICIDLPTRYVSEGELDRNLIFDKENFGKKLMDLGLYDETVRSFIDSVSSPCTLRDLRTGLQRLLEERRVSPSGNNVDTIIKSVFALARANYDVVFSSDTPLCERVLFPSSASESNGIEDARFVRFTDDDGSIRYFATYTAYNGKTIRPKLLETVDFLHFRFRTMSGAAVRNKGTALFPRKVNGRYVMLSRQDGENNSIMYSDHVEFWNESRVIMEPKYEWEFIQLGNCGSPVETEEGWLVLSHGVGAMRKYCIGAFLLDKDDPSKLIGRTRDPILLPQGSEREGYVPNVVYTCGMLLHGSNLVIPYAMSDYAIGFATVPVTDLLGVME
jgi:predicted GH43/DUF377 family glycosyl hydrolase